MEHQLILAVDCGTSSVRTIIFDAFTGEQLSVAQAAWHRSKNTDGATRFDTENNWKLICDCIKENLIDYDARKIIGITTTSFRHGLVCIDKEGEVVFACHNADPRSDEQVKKLTEAGYAEEVFKISGDWPTINALPILMWFRENHFQEFSRIWKVLSVAGWVSYRLCGRPSVELSMASASCLLDVKDRKWSREILHIARLPENILPELVESNEIVGQVKRSVAAATGLVQGIPVFVPLGDTQAAMVATGDIEPERSSVIGGTFWLQAQTTAEPITDLTLNMRTQCHCVKDIWFNEGCSFYVGPVFSWFMNTFENPAKTDLKSYTEYFDKLTEGAAIVPPGAYGVQAIFSNLTNVSNWRHSAPAFLNWDILDNSRSNKEVFFRAVLETAAIQAYGDFERIRNITGKWPKMLTFSGGASANKLLSQILSDIMVSPVMVFKNRECSALGGAMIASTASGIYNSLEKCVKTMSEIDNEYIPSRRNHEIYLDKYEKWKAIYGKLLELSDEGITKHLWIAAGARKIT